MTAPFAYSSVPPVTLPRLASHRPAGILGMLVAGYVALLPYQFQVEKGMNFAPADCFLLLALLLAAGQLKYRKAAWTIWHLAFALTFAVGSLVAALSFGQLARYELLNKDAGLLLPFLSYAAITSTVTEWEDVRRVLRVFIMSVVIENVLAVVAFLAAYFFGVDTPFARYGGLRLSGMMLDPNAYGGLLIVALAMSEGASWGRAPLFKTPTLLFSRLTLALGILFTFSRSAWVGLGLAFLLFCAVRPMVAVRPVLAGLIGAPFLILFMGSRFLPIFEVMASRPKQVQERFDLIEEGLRAFVRHPFLGGGLGSFRLAEGEVAHNSAMWFLADFGIVGLAVLLGFLIWFFTIAWFAYRFAPERERPLVLALLLAHAAMVGLAMGIEASYQRHWWLVFALIASSYSLVIGPAGHPRREAEVFAHVYP
jgi:putative inorganic carbon (hco3(-)) transporter